MPDETFNFKDIVRTNQPSSRTFGWYVRVKFLGKIHSKFFSDKKHGSKYIALSAAVTWRNEIWEKVGKPPTDKYVVTVPQKRNTTGVIGVRLDKKTNRYLVNWVRPDGIQAKTSVSIRKWGEQGAFKRACEIREEKEAERLTE